MNDRPNIKVTLTLIDKTLEVLGWVSVFVSWVLAITYYAIPIIKWRYII